MRVTVERVRAETRARVPNGDGFVGGGREQNVGIREKLHAIGRIGVSWEERGNHRDESDDA